MAQERRKELMEEIHEALIIFLLRHFVIKNNKAHYRAQVKAYVFKADL